MVCKIIKSRINKAFSDVGTPAGSSPRRARYAQYFMFLIAISWTCSGFGANKYVDPINGLDTNTGNDMQHAYKTVAKAEIEVGNGNAVYLKAGKYTEANQGSLWYLNLDNTRLGGSPKSITFRPENNDDEVIWNTNNWQGSIKCDFDDSTKTIKLQGIQIYPHAVTTAA